jgi:hypothetical protein
MIPPADVVRVLISLCLILPASSHGVWLDEPGTETPPSPGARAAVADVDPPTLTIVGPRHGDRWRAPSGPVTIEYSDRGLGIDPSAFRARLGSFELPDCVVGPSVATCRTPPLRKGRHQLLVEIADLAGNLSKSSTWFRVRLDLDDATPPAILATLPAGDVVVDDPSPEVRVIYVDADSEVDLSTLQVFVNGLWITGSCSIGPLEATCEPPELPQGRHTITAWIEDLNGNPNGSRFDFEIQLSESEEIPPRLEILAPWGTVQDQPGVRTRLRYSDEESGIAPISLTVEVDGFPVTSGCIVNPKDADCPSTILGAGEHRVTARISDFAGNRAVAHSRFEVRYAGDSNPPTLAIERPAKSFIRSGRLLVEARYGDAESVVDPQSIRVELDGDALYDGRDPTASQHCRASLDRLWCSLTEVSLGPHSVVIQVADLSGNVVTDHRQFESIDSWP